MKIDNKKKVNRRIKGLSLMLLASLILGSAVLFYHVKLNGGKQVILGFLLIIALPVFYIANRLFSLKYFDYEHSGEVISIKHYHLWQSGIVRPVIELPRNHLESFDIEEKRNLYCLKLLIKNSRGKVFCFSCKIISLTKEEAKKIQQSLQNAS